MWSLGGRAIVLLSSEGNYEGTGRPLRGCPTLLVQPPPGTNPAAVFRLNGISPAQQLTPPSCKGSSPKQTDLSKTAPIGLAVPASRVFGLRSVGATVSEQVTPGRACHALQSPPPSLFPPGLRLDWQSSIDSPWRANRILWLRSRGAVAPEQVAPGRACHALQGPAPSLSPRGLRPV